MGKLQHYGEELTEICQKHFPDVVRKIPKFKRRETSSIEKLKNASQKQVRLYVVIDGCHFRAFYERNVNICSKCIRSSVQITIVT